MTTAVSDYIVEIGFGGGIGGRFTIGSSLIGGIDILTNDWTQFFNGPHDDVTDDIASDVIASRGWDQRLASLESGKCNFSLFHSADPTYFDPNNAASPLNSVNPGFVPMRPMRVRGSNDGWVTQHGLFYGFVRAADFDYDPDSGVCSVKAEDLLLWLNRIENPVVPLTTGITSSQAVGLLLDSFGFTDPAFRNLSSLPAISSMDFSADGTVSTLDLLKRILDAEQGRMFIDGSGVFHFEDRYARDRRRAATSSFNTELIDISSRADADSIANRTTVTKTGGVAQIASDATSIHNFGIGDAGSINSPYLPSDASSFALASLILKRLKDPHPPQSTTVDNGSSAVMDALLALELQDRTTISGTDCYVERIEHLIRAGGVRHETTLLVTKAPSDLAFQIGSSTLTAAGATTDYLGG